MRDLTPSLENRRQRVANSIGAWAPPWAAQATLMKLSLNGRLCVGDWLAKSPKVTTANQLENASTSAGASRLGRLPPTAHGARAISAAAQALTKPAWAYAGRVS